MPGLVSRRSRRGAFAMPLMLVVLMVLTTITVVLVGTSARDVESSRTSAGRTEARLLAASVLEDIYARIRANPQEAFTFASSGALSSTSGFTNYKALRPQITSTNWAVLPTGLRDGSSTDPLDVTGRSIGSVECPTDFSRDCFFVRVKSTTGATSRPGAFTIYVGLRLRCGGSESRCIYAAFEQRLRRAQFYDFALAQEYATLAPEALFPAGSWDAGKSNESAYRSYASGCSTAASRRPNFTAAYTVELGDTNYVDKDEGFASTGESVGLSGCIDIAYTSGDNLGTASVYSGDEYLSLCGTPSFSRVYLAGGGTIPNSSGTAWWKKPDFCDPTVATAGNATPQFNFPVMALPTAATLAQVNTASAIDRTNAGKPVVVDLVSSSNVTVVKGDGKPATLDAVVYGNVSGQKSVIVVNGSAAIIGDVKYTNEATDSFSLTASERIEIWQSCSGGTGAPAGPSTFGDTAKGWSNSASCVPGGPATRTVHGILTSPEGFIGVPDWLTNFEDTRNQATIKFLGSMASKYQGVFGSFGANGTLLSGFKKDFTHDARFTKFVNGATVEPGFNLPPFVVESEVPVWLRLDLSEVGYSES